MYYLGSLQPAIGLRSSSIRYHPDFKSSNVRGMSGQLSFFATEVRKYFAVCGDGPLSGRNKHSLAGQGNLTVSSDHSFVETYLNDFNDPSTCY